MSALDALSLEVKPTFENNVAAVTNPAEPERKNSIL
jgi:hypothetical protein